MEKQFEYDYEADWAPYAYPASQSHFASTEELREVFSTVDLSRTPVSAAGIPLYLNGSEAILNNETENTIIFGETGSKKTRCVIRPLLYSLIGAGESFFVTDPKGELATDSKIRGYLDENNYKTVFLDFRNFRGDCCNLFDHAIQLYRSEKKEKAVESVGGIVHALADKGSSAKVDPFWQITSEELCVPIMHLLMELYAKDAPEKINMASFASLVSTEGVQCLKALLGEPEDEYSDANPDAPLANIQNTSMTMLHGVLCGSEKTTANVIVSAFSILQPFLFNEALLRMTSSTTFDVTEMYEKPTAVFIIVPDETSTYDKIAGIMLDSFYSRLIEKFTAQFQNIRTPPCRVNFVCDEFCNVSINDMGPKISACRSREIRFYLVCQSKSQLDKSYPDDAAVILGNCRNLLFLSSSDHELLEMISAQCGTTNVTASGAPETLVSVEMLKRLHKNWNYKEAIFLRDNLVYRAKLPDCDSPEYAFLEKFRSETPASVPIREQKEPEVVMAKQFQSDMNSRGSSLFVNNRINNTISSPDRNGNALSIKLQDELEQKFNELFGSSKKN